MSQYLLHIAYDFGLRWQRQRYFYGAEPAPEAFDPVARLSDLLATGEFPGDQRT